MTTRRGTRAKDPLIVAGIREDVPALRHTLALLPASTYGQVIIETDDQDDLVDLTAPSRMTVTRIAPTATAGEALCAAVTAWVSEWMPSTDESVAKAVVGEAAGCCAPQLAELRDQLGNLSFEAS